MLHTRYHQLLQRIILMILNCLLVFLYSCQIPCSGLCTFASSNYQVSLVSGYICNCEGYTSEQMTDAEGFQRILLEFKSDCFHRYQVR